MNHQEYAKCIVKLWKDNPFPELLRDPVTWRTWVEEIAVKKRQSNDRIFQSRKLWEEFISIVKDLVFSDAYTHYGRLLEGLGQVERKMVEKIKNDLDDTDDLNLATAATGVNGCYQRSVIRVPKEVKDEKELGADSDIKFSKASSRSPLERHKGANDENKNAPISFRTPACETVGSSSKLSRKRSRLDGKGSKDHSWNDINKRPKSSGLKFQPLPFTKQLVTSGNKETIRATRNESEIISPTRNFSPDTDDDIFEINTLHEDEVIENPTPPSSPAEYHNAIDTSSRSNVSLEVEDSKLSSEDCKPGVLFGNGATPKSNSTTPKSWDKHSKIKGIRSQTPANEGRHSRPLKERCRDDLESVDFEENDQPVEQDKENYPVSIDEIAVKYPKPSYAPALTLEIFDELKKVLEKPEKEKVVTGFSMYLLQEELALFHQETEWLIDKNIDFYLELIRDRSKLNGYPSVYIFHSFFYTLLSDNDGGYELVQDTTGNDDIFSYDLVFIPVNLNQHWRLVVMEYKERSLLCYDSMSHSNMDVLRNIARYLRREYKRKHMPKSRSDASENYSASDNNKPHVGDQEDSHICTLDKWNIRNIPSDEIPQQKNAIDCGIFMLQYAEYLSRRQPFDFEQAHIPYFRNRMMYESLTKKLLVTRDGIRRVTSNVNYDGDHYSA